MSLVSGLYRQGTPTASTEAEVTRRLKAKLRRLMVEIGPDAVLEKLRPYATSPADSVSHKLYTLAEQVSKTFTVGSS